MIDRVFCFCWCVTLFVVTSVFLPDAQAESLCGKSFLMTSKARVQKRASAKRIARKRVQRRARRRCRGKKLAFLARWQYQCRRSKGLILCKARSKFRCCRNPRQRKARTRRRSSQHRLTRLQHSLRKARLRKLRRKARLRKLRRKARLRKLRRKARLRKARRHRVVRRAKKRRFRIAVAKSKRPHIHRAGKGRRQCRRARVSVKGYSRGHTKLQAQLEARGAARIRAMERCGQLLPVWMKGWRYRCARSGKRHVCSAFSTVRCCKE